MVFTDFNGCSSQPLIITVYESPIVEITGDDEICLEMTTTLFPTSGGVWVSSDTTIAMVDSLGIVTPIGPGAASFFFTDDNYCTSETDFLEVVEAFNENIDTTICEGMDFEGLTESGNYIIDTIDLSSGCPLILTIELEVLPLDDPLCTVNIDEWDENSVKLYPNPANNVVFIESNSEIEEVSIYTAGYQLAGQLKFADNAMERQILVDGLRSGLYIFKIKSGESQVFRKILIE